MPNYRLYLVGSQGRFIKVEVIDGPDDAAAVADAQQYIDGQAMELWDRGRLVQKFASANLEPPAE